MELERWISSEKPILLLQRPWILFSACTWWSTKFVAKKKDILSFHLLAYIFKICIYSFLFMCVFTLIHITSAVPTEAGRGWCSSWNWSYRGLWASCQGCQEPSWAPLEEYQPLTLQLWATAPVSRSKVFYNIQQLSMTENEAKLLQNI